MADGKAHTFGNQRHTIVTNPTAHNFVADASISVRQVHVKSSSRRSAPPAGAVSFTRSQSFTEGGEAGALHIEQVLCLFVVFR